MASLLDLLIFDAVYGSWILSLPLFTLDFTLVATTYSYFTDVEPVLVSNTKVLQTGATHTVFKDSDNELLSTNNTPVEPPKTVPMFDPNSNVIVGKKSRTARRRRRKNKNKNAQKQQQHSIGGEDDTLVAISKIFENPAAEEVTMSKDEPVNAKSYPEEKETRSKDEIEIPPNNKSCVDESDVREETVINDDFGVDFKVNFDSYPELSGMPRIGDVLVYKVRLWLFVN